MCLRSEHLSEDNPGPYWQLLILLTVIDLVAELDDSGTVLGEVHVDDYVCGICLETLLEKGPVSTWEQMEPCR